jgi:aryl carrier-like protein
LGLLTGGVRASVAGSPSDVSAEVAELLGVSADTVDPSGNLISQGLDSIRMMSLAGRWRRRRIDVDLAALASIWTPATLRPPSLEMKRCNDFR